MSSVADIMRSNRLRIIVVVDVIMMLLFVKFSSGADKGSQPKITSSFQKEHWLTAGESLKLNCPVSANPDPIITWKKDGEDIHIGWERYRVRLDQLHIKAIETGDSGVYVCSATNGFGTVTVQYIICVFANDTVSSLESKDRNCQLNEKGEMPYFVNLPEMRDRYIQLVEGETLQLSCKFQGKPKPEIRWLKDGSPFSNNHNDATESWLLTLSKVKVENTGQYTCNVFNRIGNINYTYTVKVTAQQNNNAPEFVPNVLKNVEVIVGGTASLHCEVYSDLETHIEWLKQVNLPGEKQKHNNTLTVDNKQFVVVQQGSTQAQMDGKYISKLVMPTVTVSHAGIYACSAANSRGFKLHSVVLTVLPSLIDKSEETTIPYSDSMNQFLPIIAAIASIFLFLVLGIAIYLVCRHCARQRCSRSNSCVQHNLASSTSPFLLQRTENGQKDLSVIPLNHHHHHAYQGYPNAYHQYCGQTSQERLPTTNDVSHKSLTVSMTSPNYLPREHILKQNNLQLQFYEEC